MTRNRYKKTYARILFDMSDEEIRRIRKTVRMCEALREQFIHVVFANGGSRK